MLASDPRAEASGGAFEGASDAELKPHKLAGTLAFMFETRFPQVVTAHTAGVPQLQASYGADLVRCFDPTRPGGGR